MLGSARCCGVVIACVVATAACGESFTTSDVTGSTSASGGAATTSSVSTGGTGGAPALETIFFTEGSRLKANHVDLGGGAVQFLTWFDTMLGTACTFQRFVTGEIVCTPDAVAFAGRYSDPECNDPVVVVDGADPCPYEYVLRKAEPSCDDPGIGGAARRRHTGSSRARSARVAASATGAVWRRSSRSPARSTRPVS